MPSNKDEPLSFINPSSSPITVSDGENSYLVGHNAQIESSYGSFQRDSLLGSSDSDGSRDNEFGYLRPEFWKSWDRHYGVCGPPLVTRFKKEIKSHGLQRKVSVSPCSDIGGHKYARNVIIFGSNTNGQDTWYWLSL
ncbi:hypothetical protein Nepgr_026211 [Nepenthes gracilis]|uniref:Uncharacterized protein n=1 Tax=Nepenthes gracilis TaxID=150966 RepID=A0AAD3T7Q0_NEPGR|nr:hypothetical protein Nepgr_026211 [Nepenthes gracilis]